MCEIDSMNESRADFKGVLASSLHGLLENGLFLNVNRLRFKSSNEARASLTLKFVQFKFSILE